MVIFTSNLNYYYVNYREYEMFKLKVKIKFITFGLEMLAVVYNSESQTLKNWRLLERTVYTKIFIHYYNLTEYFSEEVYL